MLTFNAITHTCNMGRHQTKTCKVCFKSMRGDHLKRHMKKHDVKTKDIVATETVQKSCTSENFTGLEKEMLADCKEFDRKIELGQKLNKIMDKYGYNENMLGE